MGRVILILIIILAGLSPATSASAIDFDQTDNRNNQPASNSTPSLDFAIKLGSGWNLGNSFDSHDDENDEGEQTWDNPEVTADLFEAIKAQGFDSVRLPFTIHYRTDANGVIDPGYLARYQEVVDWALAADLYVIINVHHDSIEWLNMWDAQENSPEFQRFSSLWEQLTARFKDYDAQTLMFEAINEPRFDTLDESQQQAALTRLNQQFHKIVRRSGGYNDTRMLLMTTLLGGTEQAKLDALYHELVQYNDAYLLATVHYYGEWAFSNNEGYPLFDEALPLPDNPKQLGWSQQQASEDFIWQLNQTFVYRGIGVVIGEYGLLGYDRSDQVNPIGETYKFIAQLNQLTRYQPISLFLWDNGQHFNRESLDWYSKEFGDIVRQAIYTDSAYGRSFNTSYLYNKDEDLFVSLQYNGTFLERLLYNGSVLMAGRDYEVNQDGVYLPAGFAGEGGTLTFQFNQGATWNQHVQLVKEMVLADTELVDGEAFTIPVDFAGHDIKRIGLRSNNETLSLTYLADYLPNKALGQLVFSDGFLNKLEDGRHHLVIETFAGETVTYLIVVNHRGVKGMAR